MTLRYWAVWLNILAAILNGATFVTSPHLEEAMVPFLAMMLNVVIAFMLYQPEGE